jgi:predicted ArsR family transcriptional regulator
MSVEAPHSDNDLLDLIRVAGPLSIADLSDAMEVTATAVRQRLTRLMAHSLIQRDAVRAGRGRPRHRYWLTEKGVRQTGSNFTDLAVTLWREFRSITDEKVRRDMLRRFAKALASGYIEQIRGNTPAERLQSLAELFNQRRIPVSVAASPEGHTLTAHACPYPSLADEDPAVCDMEKMLFSELVGADVQLTHCRLEGGGECQFHTGSTPGMIGRSG